MVLYLPTLTMNTILPILAVIAALFVITTQNPIYSVLNLIVLYILVAFFLIYKGITYIGISYIIIYVGAIAILFLFILMMIDIEIVEKRNNNYLPLLCLLLVGSVFLFKNIVIKYGLIKNVNIINLNNKDTNIENYFNFKNLLNNNYNYNELFSIDKIKFEELFEGEENTQLLKEGTSLIQNLFTNKYEYYMVFTPNWESAVNNITQISGIGDILYSTYHSYIYLLSIILLLGLVGSILLTAEKNEEVRFIPRAIIKKRFNIKRNYAIPAFFSLNYIEELGSENSTESLSYYIFIVLFISVLLFGINTYLSLSMKYFDKEGGFECGFTSFIQTRERFNIIFYRVALLFLIFDLEIVLIFPYTVINHNNQTISKNNVLAFLYILVIGFIYELKEGALDIVKKRISTSFKIRF